MVSQQLTAISSRDDVAALDTSGEGDYIAIVKTLQRCVVMVREAVIKQLRRAPSSTLCISCACDRWLMRVIPLNKAQAIVFIFCAETGLESPLHVAVHRGDRR